MDELARLLELLQLRLERRNQWLDEATRSLAERPALHQVEALLKEAEGMQIQDVLHGQLQRLAASGHEWQHKCEVLLTSSSTHPPEYVVELIAAAKALPLELTTVGLEDTLSQVRACLEGTALRMWCVLLPSSIESYVFSSAALLRTRVGRIGWCGRLDDGVRLGCVCWDS